MSIIKYSGKSCVIKATVRAIDRTKTFDRLLLRDVTIDGQQGKDHYWISVRNSRGLKDIVMGTVFTARARHTRYLGLDADYNQITKQGIDHVRLILKELK